MQYDRENPIVAPHSGAEFAADFNKLLQAVLSGHSGSSRPANIAAGGTWVQTLTSPNRGRLYMFDGSTDIELLTVDYSANTVTLGATALDHLGTAATRNVGTAEGNLVEVLSGGLLPALDASNLTNLNLDGTVFPIPDAQKVVKLPANEGGGSYRSGGVIMADRTFRMWGNGSYGQQGLGSWPQYTREAPQMVSFPVGITAEPVKWVSSGYNHYVIFANGEIYVWGRNNYGELGQNSTAVQVFPAKVTAGAIDTKDVVDIQVGYSSYNDACHVLALTSDGELWTCGYNAYGQCGTGDNVDQTQFVRIGTGQTWAKIYAFGSTYGFSAAITTDGDLYTWGYNGYGQLGLGDKTDRTSPTLNSFFGGVGVSDVSGVMDNYFSGGANYGSHMVALLANGKVYTWGENGYGQLGTGNTTQFDVPQEITALGTNNVQVIACGGFDGSTFVRKSNNTIHGTGYNGRGVLGRSGTTNQNTFGEVEGSNYNTLTNMIVVGSQSYQALFALYSDGRIKCCGYNGNGQLGIGTNVDRTGSMTYVRLHERVKAVSLNAVGTSSEAGLGILTDTGQYLQTGYGGDGQNGDKDEQSLGVPRLFRF